MSKQFLAELTILRREQSRAVNPIPEIMVMEELPQPKPAYILKRGAYDAPGERVTADTPRALPPFPAGTPHDRLGLARWLTDPDHPLTNVIDVTVANLRKALERAGGPLVHTVRGSGFVLREDA